MDELTLMLGAAIAALFSALMLMVRHLLKQNEVLLELVIGFLQVSDRSLHVAEELSIEQRRQSSRSSVEAGVRTRRKPSSKPPSET